MRRMKTRRLRSPTSNKLISIVPDPDEVVVVVCLFFLLFYSYTEEELNPLAGAPPLDLYRSCPVKYKCMCLYLMKRRSVP